MDKKVMELTLLLGGLHYCASELAKIDSAYKQKLEGIDIVFQWKAEPDGPNTYTVIKDSTIEFVNDAVHESPTFTVIGRDLDLALRIFKGIYVISEAVKNDDVEFIGDKQEFLNYTFYLEDLVPYIGELTGSG
jgi:hypothetical protein